MTAINPVRMQDPNHTVDRETVEITIHILGLKQKIPPEYHALQFEIQKMLYSNLK